MRFISPKLPVSRVQLLYRSFRWNFRAIKNKSYCGFSKSLFVFCVFFFFLFAFLLSRECVYSNSNNHPAYGTLHNDEYISAYVYRSTCSSSLQKAQSFHRSGRLPVGHDVKIRIISFKFRSFSTRNQQLLLFQYRVSHKSSSSFFLLSRQFFRRRNLNWISMRFDHLIMPTPWW